MNSGSKTTEDSLYLSKDILAKILHFVITILTAIATTLGTTSCIGA